MKRWKIKKEAPKSFIERFPEFSPVVLQLLYNRGITKEREIEKFLNPDWERDLYDPFLMKGMKETIGRIQKALKKKEKIALLGHFDVDGITATALLYLVFKKLGLHPIPYIPSRKEGYGITEEAVRQLQKEKINLLISVDTGITCHKEVELAKKLKMDVIITDHHEVPKNIPKAEAVLNPKQKNCPYPFKELSGVGVVFKLTQALFQKCHDTLIHDTSDTFLKWLVDLVGLGTICDVVPLIEENRLFAKFGLIVLNKTKRIGLLKLYEKAQINLGKIDPYAVSYIIGPRLNAPGRMDHANASFYLLTTEEPEKADALSKILDDYNKSRQEILEKVLKEAKEEVKAKNMLAKKLILLGKKEWPLGIIGLIAGRLKDEYSRPVVAVTVGGEKSKASARSIDTFHLVEILGSCSEYLIKFGGHKKAAGFTVFTSKLEELKKRLIDLAEERLTEEDVTPTIEIDSRIALSDISWDLWEQLAKFEPTGASNPPPVFLASDVRVEDVKTVANDKHLKMQLYGIEAIYFKAGNLVSSLSPSDIIDIVFQIKVDEWQSQRRLILKILDLRKSEGVKE